MGIKDLWPLITPYSERKPIYELQGKIVAIDLAGWVCESLNVVDYFVHPRQHLKNLFFRTYYLLVEGVVPVFVLEGTAPKLKENVINKRNEIQFRGVKPKDSETETNKKAHKKDKEPKGRTRFKHVLKQCETLLNCMGITCIQGPGEAEAYCAYLNKYGLVDGVVSQDSDCFAYGAITVYRNFSLSSQGNTSGQGGAVDVYDMAKIRQHIDIGQEKIIIMSLLCGCDYCEGVPGVGKDAVMKLFTIYKNDEIMQRVRSWRDKDDAYTALEMKVDNKNICSNCGHFGKTVTHTKSGCSTCNSHRGCDETLWKLERLSIKAELSLRKKALLDPNFPSEEIIDEFLREPSNLPKLNLKWKQPNLVKFLKQIGNLLQWPEIYCFQKFLPLLTRWQIVYNNNPKENTGYVEPDTIYKKRTLKGNPSFEVIWKDPQGFFNDLIPDNEIETYISENPRGIQLLWSTIEPSDLFEKAYPEIVHIYLKSIEKPIKLKQNRKKKIPGPCKNDSLNNMNDLLAATEEISKTLKNKKQNTKKSRGLQAIDKFFQRQNILPNCSTPKSKSVMSDLQDLECENYNENDDNLSEIIRGIVSKPTKSLLRKHNGRTLIYEQINLNSSSLNQTQDDLSLLPKKRKYSSFIYDSPQKCTPQKSIPDSERKTKSIDDLILIESEEEEELKSIASNVDRFFKNKSSHKKAHQKNNVSFFFSKNYAGGGDEFEKSLDISFLKNDHDHENKENYT